MDNELDLAALRAFRSVIREGSFTAAALALRVPKSTLSKRIADLEALLGTRLFERSTRHLRITQEGEVLALRVERLLGEADDIRRALGEQGGAPKGHLRLAVPPVMGHVMMGRIAAEFRATYPEVTLELHFLDRTPDLLEQGFDGAIRFGPLEDSTQIARLLLHGHATLAAAPGLDGLDRIRHPADLAGFPQVTLAAGWIGPWVLENGGERVEIAPRPGLALGSFLAVRDAVVAGAGVALLPWLLAQPAFADGSLRPVLPDWATPHRGMYFVYPSAHSLTARLRAFIDHLAQSIQRLDLPA
ncbi:LysR family transcriptional regulator [Gemmobacter fulvus]|uniref:LysR family transcriptional regulator n=1 Tax=Gemmobacter fulvus TaxID=2840474 RepID=A0A975P792_9RHOB|nr:LysR family transcriptional regulator [Gemmobacter fulvus]MBT9245001.1 LysR family transcriptional regulator [Gemmobacter fulvus]QWK90647.1 LysR family transcriptional regulator [Gemmobacter fulvus]